MTKMIGRRYGKLVINKRISSKNNTVLCKCDCGNEVEILAPNLIQGRKKHCGCDKYADRDETGKTYGRWKVLGKHENSFEKWECRCDCGNEGVVARTNLINGWSKSCGCLQKERATEGGKRNRRFSVQDARYRKTRPNVNSWRKQVMERDGGRCQICGTTENIVVHHKNGWHVDVDGRMDVENGASVCREHHNDFHSKYGKGNSTMEQWEQYKTEMRGVLSIQIPQI